LADNFILFKEGLPVACMFVPIIFHTFSQSLFVEQITNLLQITVYGFIFLFHNSTEVKILQQQIMYFSFWIYLDCSVFTCNL